MAPKPVPTLSISFGDPTTDAYDDSGANPTISLLSDPVVTTTGNASDHLTKLTFDLSNPSDSLTLALDTAAANKAANNNISFHYNANTGVLRLVYDGGGNGPSDAVWSAILNGITYNNTADEPNGPDHVLSLHNAQSNDPSGYSSITSGTETVDVTCFCAGTMIRTPTGEVPVESLRPGDCVTTAEGAALSVRWLGRQTVSTVFSDKLRVLPIRIKAGAIADQTPLRDLLVSPDHAIFIDGVLIHAGALVNGTSIVRETEVPAVFPYYHVEVDAHALIVAEGAPVESFVDNVDRLRFDNWAEHEALYPHGKPVTELPYARAKAFRQIPREIRAKLAARAEAIGAMIAAVA